MKKIFFRGFSRDDKGSQTIRLNDKEIKGDWIFGGIYHVLETYHIKNLFEDFIVISETIGQFTGLKDKNGNGIYEGDVVKRDDVIHDGEVQIYGGIYAVEFEKGCYIMKNYNEWKFLTAQKHITIIGNIYENPELMEETI